MESDEIVKNIVQLLDAKQEDMRKRTESQNCEFKHNKMLGILREFVKAEWTGNWMLHLQTVRDMLSYFAATDHNTYTNHGILDMTNFEGWQIETLMYISQCM